jgi:hypothetical protein
MPCQVQRRAKGAAGALLIGAAALACGEATLLIGVSVLITGAARCPALPSSSTSPRPAPQPAHRPPWSPPRAVSAMHGGRSAGGGHGAPLRRSGGDHPRRPGAAMGDAAPGRGRRRGADQRRGRAADR